MLKINLISSMAAYFFINKFTNKNGFTDYEVKFYNNFSILIHAVIDYFPFIHKYYD